MLTMPRFAFAAPASLDEVLALKAAHGARALLVAGGTDAMPNLKHGLHEPGCVVHLGRVAELRGVRDTADGVVLGALFTLSELAAHPRIAAAWPGLARAASLVASPQIRNMGTLGGNLCLDTRCTYYNQTHFWREALGFCLKKDGTRCHVVTAGKRCVAAHSSDVAPMLIALGATVAIAGAAGRRTIPVDAFFVGDGVHNNVLEPHELVTHVTIPAAAAGLRTGYQKLRPRGAIDFPMLSVAVAARAGAAIESLALVVSALGARPRVVTRLDELAVGQAPSDAVFDAVAAAAHKQCTPLSNVPYDVDWRRAMVPVFVKRALRDALGSGS